MPTDRQMIPDPIPGIFRTPEPLTPDQATRTAYAAYAAALLGPSPFHTAFWDGALEQAEPLVAQRVTAPARWATASEIAAVRAAAEDRDDRQYAAIETAARDVHYDPALSPQQVYASLNFLAVLTAEAPKRVRSVDGAAVTDMGLIHSQGDAPMPPQPIATDERIRLLEWRDGISDGIDKLMCVLHAMQKRL